MLVRRAYHPADRARQGIRRISRTSVDAKLERWNGDRLRISLPLALAVVALVACGPAASTSSPPLSAASPSPTATQTPDASNPVGVIAFGHSGLTGEGTGGQFEAVFENSWATRTSREVNSVYLRLTAVRPETDGHVANTAHGGASAFELPDQARRALQEVPVPALVIVSTIDNDIRCDGTDPEHVVEFGIDVAEALDVITTASPNSKILVVGQLGRPSPTFVEELVAHDPSVQESLTGTGMCDFYDPAGNLVVENFETLTAIIESYEAEQARVCAAVPNCQTDGGVRAAYVDTIENFASDYAHLNILGQAAEAELIWPVVADLLGL
jgi:hypothetical protein